MKTSKLLCYFAENINLHSDENMEVKCSGDASGIRGLMPYVDEMVLISIVNFTVFTWLGIPYLL
jgi:hypothetical protein